MEGREDKLLNSFIDNLRDDLDSTKYDGFIGVNAPEQLDSFLTGETKYAPEIYMTIHPIKQFDLSNKSNKGIDFFRKVILEKRKYDNFFHYDKIRDENNCSKHFLIPDLNKEYVIKSTKKGYSQIVFKSFKKCWIEYKIDRKNIYINNISNDLLDILKDEEKEIIKDKIINLCDFIFFGPKLKQALAIPLPFTSVPTMILVTSFDGDEKNKIKRIRDITNATKETRLNFLFNRFVQRLSDKPNFQLISTEDFVKWFVIQISEVLLPITYSINLKSIQDSSEEISVFKNKLCNDKDTLNEIIFSLRKEHNEDDSIGKLTMNLKSYHFPKPDCEKPDCEKKYDWFHELEANGKTQGYIKDTIESLFTTLYIKWKEERISELKTKKEAIKAAIANIVSRGMAHTDASHTMLTFENIYINQETVSALNFVKYNTHLRNMMDLVADISGGLGQQTLFRYAFSEVYSEVLKLFSERPKSGGFTKSILGSGLLDDKGFAVLQLSEHTKASSELLEMDIALPGGENGKTALINLLKGFFRNLYKHTTPLVVSNGSGRKKTSVNTYVGELCLRVNQGNEIDDKIKNEYVQINLVDKSSDYEKSIAQDLKKKINGLINAPLFSNSDNHEMRVRQTGWGLLEMKIAAAYLIRIPLEEYELLSIEKNKSKVFQLENNTRWFPKDFFQVDIEPSENGRQRLYYKFYLLRSKLIGVNLDNANEINHANRKAYAALAIKSEKSNNYKYFVDNNEDCLVKRANFKRLRKSVFLNLLNKKKDFNEEDIDFLWTKDFLTTKNKLNSDNSFPNFVITNESSGIDESKIVFDDHDKLFLNLKNKSQSNKISELDYYESFNSSQFQEVFNKESKTFKSKYKSQILEGVYTRVAVLDERIQDLGSKKIERLNDLTQKELWDYKGIFTPSMSFHKSDDFNYTLNDTCQVISLEKLMYGKVHNLSRFEILKELISFYADEYKCDYILLHFSGLEKIVENDADYFDESDSQKRLNQAYKELVSLIKDKPKYLILISGKGTPSNIPKNSYFLSLNNLEYGLFKSKFDLVKTLNALRPLK